MHVQQDSQQEKILPISKKEGMRGQCREAVADDGGGGSRKPEFRGASSGHSSNHVPFLSRSHVLTSRPTHRDPQLTAQLLTLQVSLISLCSGCVMANWTVINTHGCARLDTMNLDRGTEIPCPQATP